LVAHSPGSGLMRRRVGRKTSEERNLACGLGGGGAREPVAGWFSHTGMTIVASSKSDKKRKDREKKVAEKKRQDAARLARMVDETSDKPAAGTKVFSAPKLSLPPVPSPDANQMFPRKSGN